MRKTRQVARMALGGAVCGGLLGIPLGAAVGVLIGLFCGHVSWGLDGAVVGILALSAAGAGLGAYLGITADEHSLTQPDDIGLLPRRGDFFPRAGKGAPPPEPRR
jgi:hypothetical protein